MNNRTRGPAARVPEAGNIFVSGGAPTIACTARHGSDSGALPLIGPGVFGIPTPFYLAVVDKPRRACRSGWRDLNSIAIEFV